MESEKLTEITKKKINSLFELVKHECDSCEEETYCLFLGTGMYKFCQNCLNQAFSYGKKIRWNSHKARCSFDSECSYCRSWHEKKYEKSLAKYEAWHHKQKKKKLTR